jgi:hypothetical protein
VVRGHEKRSIRDCNRGPLARVAWSTKSFLKN